MIVCPKCGYSNPDGAMNCARCRINLEFAEANPGQLRTASEIEADRVREQRARAERANGVLVTTTPTVQGAIITQYLGLVSSVVVLGSGFASEVSADLADLTGTRSGAFQQKVNAARDAALQELKEQADKMGAQAVVGTDVDYLVTARNMFVVAMNGTAVTLGPA